MSKKPRLLCVDDEPALLEGLKLNLRKRFSITTADGPAEALALFEEAGGTCPFDVVLSDMRMPGMSGAEFLTILCERFPETPRLLLSGQSDLDSAIAAINDAKIFRFITKPCKPSVLIEALDEALEQARLRTVERDLLNDTLSGTVTMLSDVLGLVSTQAHDRTTRLRATVEGICEALGRPVLWELDLAVRLSQIGYVVMPAQAGAITPMDAQHAELGAEMLGTIPRMGSVASMIRRQADPEPIKGDQDRATWTDDELNHEVLRVAVLFDSLLVGGQSRAQAHASIKGMSPAPPGFIIDALGEVRQTAEAMVEVDVEVTDLAPGMQLVSDVMLRNGTMLTAGGTAMSFVLIERIRAFASSTGVEEPIRVLVAASVAASLN